tara:strand:+ start:31 stop:822 length:792 start_codon:yes stop_codon:yes gene_type:complete
MYIDRETFAQEIKLRQLIRESVRVVKSRRQKGNLKEEKILRAAIRKIITEVSGEVEDSPHRSTGINVLEDLLKKIIPVIEIDYKKMTTSNQQRSSYVSHMLKAVENSLAPVKANDDADADVGSMMEQEVNIDIKDEEPEEFIDVRGENEKEELSPEEEEKENFGIEGSDTTGRDMAFDTFKKIEANIVDSYEVLSAPEDQGLFYDYLQKNLNLYFEKFEDELMPAAPEVDNLDAEGGDEYDLEDPVSGVEDEDELDLADIADL